MSHYRMWLNEIVQRNRYHLQWSERHSGPAHAIVWEVVALVNGIEYGKGIGYNRASAAEIAAEAAFRSLNDGYRPY